MFTSGSLKKYLNSFVIACVFRVLFIGCRLQGLSTVSKTLISKKYIHLNDTLYADRFELTNEEYKIFLADIKSSNPGLLPQCIQDTDAWNIYPEAKAAHLAKNYFIHPAFNNYPVCCISWQAANIYCKWLTDRNNKETSQRKVIFRLPTPNEWTLLAGNPNKDGLDTQFPKGYDSVTHSYQFNYNNNDTLTHIATDGGYFTVDVNSYWINAKGILNMHGNVAEMTSIPNICKGGSWNDNLQNCSVYAQKHYALPSAEVGIRVFAVVK